MPNEQRDGACSFASDCFRDGVVDFCVIVELSSSATTNLLLPSSIFYVMLYSCKKPCATSEQFGMMLPKHQAKNVDGLYYLALTWMTTSLS